MQQKRYCLFCSKELTKPSQKKFCSDSCARKYHFKQRCDEVEKTGIFPQSGRFNETDRRFAKAYLEEKIGHVCQICGNTIWNDQPIPLITDHIDGDSSNHNVTNIRLICPNCDALLATYKSRNLTNENYIPGDRKQRKQEEYDKKLKEHGFERCEPKKKQYGTCLECGKIFEKKKASQKYCSRACADKNR